MQRLKIDDRQKLLRMIQGESLDNSLRYWIEYSLDIRGNITIWSGVSYFPEDINPLFSRQKQRVVRNLLPIYDYPRLSPHTARIYQIEQDLNREISDEALLTAYSEFRETHKTDGFGFGSLLLLSEDLRKDDEGNPLRRDRDDRQAVLDRLLKQERQDILDLRGVDCPPDVNGSERYGERLKQNRGQVSEWFKQEFARIGGDFDKLWERE